MNSQSNARSLPHDNSIDNIGQYDSSGLIEALPVAVYTCNQYGQIIFYNQAAAALWGRQPELGKDLWCGSWKIYNPDGSPLDLDSCPMALTLKEGRSISGEEIIIERPDGSRRNVLPHPQPIFDDAGNIKGAVNTLVDITDNRKKDQIIAESEKKYRELSSLLEIKVDERTENLKKSEERYHKMVEEVQDYAILLLDKDGNILNWNLGAENIKGYRESEIIGKNFRIFYSQEDRDNKLPETLINRAIETGRATHEGWRIKKNGDRFWGLIVITALHDDNQNIIGFSKVTRDLTERKLAEDQMRDAAREIEFRNKQLEEYAHIASHDLQEPLRKIQTFAEILERKGDDPETFEKYLIKIKSSAKRMVELIKNVLEYSQLSQTSELFKPTDLNEIIADIREDFELLIADKNVEVIVSDLPVINAIPIQIRQLFSNLMGNALKFSTEYPVINIRGEEVGQTEQSQHPQLKSDLDYVKIIFKDNGIGFDSLYTDQIFKLFQRLHNNNASGTGIGLALCKKIAENHNGHIHVSSELNKGTTFTVYLPLDKAV